MSLSHTCFLLFCKWVCQIRKWRRSIFPGRKKILIIKTDGLGDMLLFLPYLKQIQYWAEENSCDLTFVVSPVVISVLRQFDFKGKLFSQPRYRGFFQWFFFRCCFLLRNHADIVIKAQCLPSDLMECYTPDLLISCGIRSLNMKCTIDIEGKSILQLNEEIIKQLGIV